jgi:hypothetical protein
LVNNLIARARTVVENGTTYLVAPMVLIVPGVLNGSEGPIFYPAEELAKDVTAWNGMPLLLGHPWLDGKPASAKTPGVIDKTGLGHVRNSTFWEGRLIAEGWFERETARRVDARVVDSLERGNPIELSTGLYMTRKPVPPGATFNGTAYNHVGSNFRPDHVAVLLDSVGACGIKDGCGVLINEELVNEEGTVFNQLSHDDLRSSLQHILTTRHLSVPGSTDRVQVITVFDRHVVYASNNRLYRIGYRTDLRSDKVELVPEIPIEVKRTISYTPIHATHTGGSVMNREQTIAWLTANCHCWKDGKAQLDTLTDVQLNNLKSSAETAKANEAVANAAREGMKKIKGTDVPDDQLATEVKTVLAANSNPAPTPSPAPAPTPAPAPQPQPARLTPEEQATLNWAKAEMDRQKQGLVDKITANTADANLKSQQTQWLMQKPLTELQAIAALVPAPAPANPFGGFFVPGGPPAAVTNQDKEEPLVLPGSAWGDN